MTRLIGLMLPFVLLEVLSLPAFAGVGDKALPPEKVPALSVPKMSQPPTIDGAINPEEWREATAVSGVGNWVDDVLVPRPTTFYLGWDDGHLYFAVRTYLRPGYKPNVPAGRSHGLAYVWDDGMELHFQPLGKNVPAGNANNSYKCFLNCLGFLGDNSRMALGQAFKNWNPKFFIKTGLTAPGTAPKGGRWWELELSSTPEDFELAGPHRSGDQWRAMFAFNHVPGWMQARIPCNGPFQDPFGFNVLTLVENTPAVQMTMDSLSNLATDGTAAMKIQAHNPTASRVTLALEVNVADTIKRTVPLAVAAGQSGEFVLHEKLPEAVKAGNL